MNKNYMGFKMIKAEPMNLGDYNKFKGWTIPADEDPLREGYKVEYSDDYVSWSPKKEFDEAYMEVIPNDKLKSDISISQEMVDDFIKNYLIVSMGNKTTIVKATLINGFEITKTSSCVDVLNYDEKIGADNCKKAIKSEIWYLLGFLLQTAKNGINK